MTRFRFVNSVPDESNLDVLVNSTSVANNVAYGTSTGYQSVQSGSQQVVIEPSGSSTALLTQSVSFSSGSDTTIIASNFSSNISALVLTDDNSAPSSGDFKLRVVNAAPGLGPADVYIVAPATDLNTVSPTLSSLGFDSLSLVYSRSQLAIRDAHSYLGAEVRPPFAGGTLARTASEVITRMHSSAVISPGAKALMWRPADCKPCTSSSEECVTRAT